MTKEKKTLSTPIFSAIYWAVVAVCIAVDQLTKHFIYDKLMGGVEYRHLDVIGKFVVFDTILNDGAMMGIDLPNVVLFITTLIGLPLFVWLMYRSRTRSVWGQIAFSLMLGGTIGNAIDRFYVAGDGTFFSGQVRDFIHFDFSAWGLKDFFPYSFNIADSCLVVGVIMALLAIVIFDPDSLLKIVKEEKSAANAEAHDDCQGPHTTDSDSACQTQQCSPAQTEQPFATDDKSDVSQVGSEDDDENNPS